MSNLFNNYQLSREGGIDRSALSAYVVEQVNIDWAHLAVIGIIGCLLLIASLLCVWAFCQCENYEDDGVMSCYLINLSLADLLFAIVIVPMSLYSAIRPHWNFLERDHVICKSTAYLETVLLCVVMYTYAWISVDRFSAFSKPSRYVLNTITRCRCWMAFSWATSMLFASPILTTKMEVKFYPEIKMCMVNWRATIAYSLTLCLFVIIPAFFTVLYTAFAICLTVNRPYDYDKVQKVAMETDKYFPIAAFVIVSFILAWAPLIALFVAESWIISADGIGVEFGPLKFWLLWTAIGCNAAKILIYSALKSNFRRSLLAALCWCVPMSIKRSQCCACCCVGQLMEQIVNEENKENTASTIVDATVTTPSPVIQYPSNRSSSRQNKHVEERWNWNDSYHPPSAAASASVALTSKNSAATVATVKMNNSTHHQHLQSTAEPNGALKKHSAAMGPKVSRTSRTNCNRPNSSEPTMDNISRVLNHSHSHHSHSGKSQSQARHQSSARQNHHRIAGPVNKNGPIAHL